MTETSTSLVGSGLENFIEFIVVVVLILGLPLLGAYLFKKVKEKGKNKPIERISKEFGIPNLLSHIGLNSLTFPFIFIGQDEEKCSYVSEFVYTSSDEFLKKMLLENAHINHLEILFAVDQNFKKYTVSFHTLGELGISHESLQALWIPIFTPTGENCSFDFLEKLLCDPTSGYEYLWDEDLIEYKNKNLPKTMDTIIKIINYDF